MSWNFPGINLLRRIFSEGEKFCEEFTRGGWLVGTLKVGVFLIPLEAFALLINPLISTISEAMTLKLQWTFALLLAFFLSSRVKLSHTEHYSTPSFALHIREFAAGFCRGYFPRVFCICKQILFCLWEKILLIWKLTFFIWEQNIFIGEIFFIFFIVQ